jgi:ATP/maltotriose-dependent transcriptional regulator MalT
MGTMETAPGLRNGFAYPGVYLTRRQLQILKLAASGLSYKEIQAELGGVHLSTVKYHLNVCYAKLSVEGLVQAMHAMGWVSIK